MQYSVLIIDLDKISTEQWKELWTTGTAFYVAKIKEESYKKVTDAVDQIQEDELQII